jgi:opacity protein-like surface antigen
MVKTRTVQVLMVLAVLLWSTGAVQARDLFKDAQADVFVLGGGSTLVDAHYYSQAGNRFHSRFDMGSKITVGVAVPYGKLLTIETAFTTGPNDLYVSNVDIFPHTQKDGSIKPYPSRTYIGSLSAVVHAPVSLFHLRPYAAGGVEYDRFSPTPGALAEAKNAGFGTVSTAIITHNDKFGLNLGGGIDRKLTKRITFRIDLRDHITSSPAFGLPSQPTTDSYAIFPVSGRANNIVYTAGILFHLGKL